MRRVLPSALVAAAAAAAACALLAGPAVAVTDEQVGSHVNSVRARMGLAPLALDPRLSDGCRRHGLYLQANQGAFAENAHQERPGLPGYTPQGDEAARTSGLSASELTYVNDSTFGPSAPWHNMIAFTPFASTLHRGAAGGYDCIGTGGPAPPGAYAQGLTVWPPSGSTAVPYEVRHAELPYSPSRFLGVAESALVGPSLYILGAPLQSAPSSCPWTANITLSGPDGPVDILLLTPDSRGPAGETPYLYGGVMAVVRRPLRPSTTYTLDATVDTTQRCVNDPRLPVADAAAEQPVQRSVRSTLTTIARPIYPAKLKVLGSSLRAGQVEALFSITGRATGSLTVDLQAAGRFRRYFVDLGPARAGEKSVRLQGPLAPAQRGRTSAILNVAYAGNDETRSDSLRLRAAAGKSRLTPSSVTFAQGRLRAAGTVDARLRGVVRLRVTYQELDGAAATWTGRAPIRAGRWALDAQLPPQAAQDLNAYLTIQFTGHAGARGGPYRGEQTGRGLLGLERARSARAP